MSGWEELRRSGHVLLVSCIAYMLVCFVATHLVALIMLDAAAEFGFTIATYSLAQGAGNLVKGIALVVAGPVMERFGPHNVANATLIAATALLAVLALAPTPPLFVTALVALISITAFAEQPTYVVIQATFFQALQSVATSSITTSYSASGAILPLALAPVLEHSGWRSVCWSVVGVCSVAVVLALVAIKQGPLAVGERVPAPVASPVGNDSGRSEQQVQSGGKGDAVRRKWQQAAAAVVAGASVEEAIRMPAFWALAAANYLFMVYAAVIVNHLPMVLRTDAGLGVVEAAQVMSLQFAAAMGAKFAVGFLLALPTPPRRLLFIGAPLAYTATHALLLDVDMQALLAADVAHALVVTRSPRRLRVYGVAVGLAFGVLFGLIQCLPIRLFGRRSLPTLQSLMYAIVILGNATVLPVMGYLRDAYEETYAVPLLVSFAASAVLQPFFCLLMVRDREATQRARVLLL